jgi:hypothetical protein
MTDNQQARDFFPRLFSDCEAKIVAGLMCSNILISRGAVTGYSPSGFVFFAFFDGVWTIGHVSQSVYY